MLRSRSCSPSVPRSFCTQAPTETPKLGLIDVETRGFWGGVLILPCSMSGISSRARARMLPPNPLRKHKCIAVTMDELRKRRIYDQRVRDVEMSTFTPLVFSASGGFGPSALVTYLVLVQEDTMRPHASPTNGLCHFGHHGVMGSGCDAA